MKGHEERKKRCEEEWKNRDEERRKRDEEKIAEGEILLKGLKDPQYRNSSEFKRCAEKYPCRLPVSHEGRLGEIYKEANAAYEERMKRCEEEWRKQDEERRKQDEERKTRWEEERKKQDEERKKIEDEYQVRQKETEEKSRIQKLRIEHLIKKTLAIVATDGGVVIKESRPEKGDWHDPASFVLHYYQAPEAFSEENWEKIFYVITDDIFHLSEDYSSFVDVMAPHEVPQDIALEDFYKVITWNMLNLK
jgi:hypothetical protein